MQLPKQRSSIEPHYRLIMALSEDEEDLHLSAHVGKEYLPEGVEEGHSAGGVKSAHLVAAEKTVLVENSQKSGKDGSCGSF